MPLSTLPPAIAALYPFESRYYTVGGHQMHYIREGSGEPVVCVHGNPAWSFSFRNLVLQLRGRCEVLAADHIGCGLSDKPGDREYHYTLCQRVHDFTAFMDHALPDRTPVTLVVHDWGGMIGTAWAARNPGRVRRMVIMNTAAFRIPQGHSLPWQVALGRSGGPVSALLIRGFNAFVRGALRIGLVNAMAPTVRDGFLYPYDSWANRIATLRFVQDIPLKPRDPAYGLVADTDDSLTSLADKPMLLAWGMRDPVFTPSYLSAWRERFPKAQVREFPGAGHYLLEDDTDGVCGAIATFIAST